MRVDQFFRELNADFFAGVPDSQLKPLCNYLMDTYGVSPAHHIITANEGNAVGLAAGYYLATGKVPVVYLQNSGEGNIINPVASLISEQVYGVPILFIVGWRGEPGIHDEPQHIFQGQVTLKLLEDMDIQYYVLSSDTRVNELQFIMQEFRKAFLKGKSTAIVVRKGALSYTTKTEYKNRNTLTREEIIRQIVQVSGADPIVSTTGKASRELYEIREANDQGHQYDFLTVGSMGHASSIALGIAAQKQNVRVWCIDGDGAVLMHMGAMAVIGACAPNNLIHIVINNGAHESVGGMPTVAQKINLSTIACASGYKYVTSVEAQDELIDALKTAKASHVLSFIEAKSAIGSRPDLGRPKASPIENRNIFVNYLSKL